MCRVCMWTGASLCARDRKWLIWCCTLQARLGIPNNHRDPEKAHFGGAGHQRMGYPRTPSWGLGGVPQSIQCTFLPREKGTQHWTILASLGRLGGSWPALASASLEALLPGRAGTCSGDAKVSGCKGICHLGLPHKASCIKLSAPKKGKGDFQGGTSEHMPLPAHACQSRNCDPGGGRPY